MDPAVRIEAGRIRRAPRTLLSRRGPQRPYRDTNTKRRLRANIREACSEGAETALLPPPRMRDRFPPLNGLGGSGFGPGLLCLLSLSVVSRKQPAPANNHGRKRREHKPRSAKHPEAGVKPFEDLSGTPQSAMITRGLAAEVVGKIARFKEIIVVTQDK